MSDLSTISRLLDALRADLQADESSHLLRKARHTLENAQADLEEQSRRFPAHVVRRNGRLLVLREPATPPALLAAIDALHHAEHTLARMQQGTRLSNPPCATNTTRKAEEIDTLGIDQERRIAQARGNMYLSGD